MAGGTSGELQTRIAVSTELRASQSIKLMAMPGNFESVFAKLRVVFTEQVGQFSVMADTPVEYTLVTKAPSPFPQHKGHPMWFGAVRLGKAYVSFHLMPLYMNPALTKTISPALKKHMQGKACFNFKTDPEPDMLTELKGLTKAAIKLWDTKGWL
jgi:hypothetical protein